MEAEARYTYVGAGVLALIAALVIGLYWLQNIGGRGEFKYYAINFEQQVLDGLEVGADVTLRGIKVGRVEDYALSDEKLNRVRVVIRVDSRTPVRTNTVATVNRKFVTGIARIVLITREPSGQVLTKVPPGERYPVIAEGSSELDELAGRANMIGENIAVALDNVNELLSPQNRAAVTQTLHNLQVLSDGLNQRLGALDQTLQRVDGAAVGVGQAARQLGQAGARVGDRLGGTLDEADRTLAEARAAMTQLTTAADTLQEQAATSAERLQQSVQRADDQLAAALSEIRLSTEAATRLLDNLRDPRAALLGPGKAQLGPGEKLP